MSFRIPVTPIIAGLFGNVPIEAEGEMTDKEIVREYGPSIPHKTFSRIRIKSPRTVTAEQVLLIARLADGQAAIDASNVLAHARCSEASVSLRMELVAAASVFSRSEKSLAEAMNLCDKFASEAKRIELFDRASSFRCLLPKDEDYPVASVQSAGESNIAVSLTQSSLVTRIQSGGDAMIERLIDLTASNSINLNIIEERNRYVGRLRRSMFEDARAVSLLDRKAMFILPDHARTIRFYHADHSSLDRKLIDLAAHQLSGIQRLRINFENRKELIRYLESWLSYRLPTSQK